ncbi:hypothetical protein KI688_006735 [Linnemannia hyalina]|uniref:Uncharacterized protein n=1 Tax=Linnemannia hyalina TaxID=64524 RepID=A0A9P7XIP9_9FUNG|nr:hypothetical protein KI688_006735 [Linnemannia hyalina]
MYLMRNGDPPELPKSLPPEGQVYFEEEHKKNKDKEGFDHQRVVIIRSNDIVGSELPSKRQFMLLRAMGFPSETIAAPVK